MVARLPSFDLPRKGVQRPARRNEKEAHK